MSVKQFQLQEDERRLVVEIDRLTRKYNDLGQERDLVTKRYLESELWDVREKLRQLEGS